MRHLTDALKTVRTQKILECKSSQKIVSWSSKQRMSNESILDNKNKVSVRND